MGCNCGGGALSKARTGSYVLILPDGSQQTFATESEAKVANRKTGGKGLIRRAR